MLVKILFVLGVLCSFTLITPTAYACSCAYTDPPSAFNDAKVIFIGRMLGGSEKLSLKDNKGKAYSLEAGTVQFQIEESFKGDAVGQISIAIASHKDTSCGPYGLSKGVRYLVYAYAATKADTTTLYSGVCTRTIRVDQQRAQEDLTFLRNIPPAGTGGNLRGRIWADLRAGGATPLPNLKVDIRGADERVLTTFTNDRGEFEAKFLKAGKYTVTPEFPKNYFSEQSFREVVIEDQGTADVGFEAYIDGRVRGRVVDKEGNAFNSAFLHLRGQKMSTYGHATREDGGFEVSGVPPGEYFLYLEMENEDYNKNRNYYYPGTFKREEATSIKVALGEKIEGLQFTLPEGFLVRSIEGQVTWKDGKPAANVEVGLYCPASSEADGFTAENGPAATTTDERGRFKLEGFTGETYWIEARGTKQNRSESETIQVHSRARKIVLNDNLSALSLVMSENGFGEGCPD